MHRMPLAMFAALLFAARVGGAAPAVPRLTLTETPPAAADQFGFAVALVGSRLAVGVPYADLGARRAGLVRLLSATDGAALATFQNPTPVFDDEFGFSVAGAGENVVVGAPFADVDTGDARPTDDAGEGYLFNASGQLLRTLAVRDIAAKALLGFSAAGTATRAILGAPGADLGGVDNAGSVFLFDPATGGVVLALASPNARKGNKFGFSVAADGNLVGVGEPFANSGQPSSGAAYVFDLTTGGVVQTLQNPSPDRNDQFGYAVAVDTGRIVVGAPFDNTGAQGAGAAYLYDANTGALLKTFTNPTARQGESFGSSVAIAGDRVYVGAANAESDLGAVEAGQVYVFQASSGQRLGTFERLSPQRSDHYGGGNPRGTDYGGGVGVAAEGDVFAVGAPAVDVGGLSDAGTVLVYDLGTDPGPGPGPGPGGTCTVAADCNDNDLCTIDSCATDATCRNTTAVSFDALACRLARTAALLASRQPAFVGPRALHFRRAVKQEQRRVERARKARPRRAVGILRQTRTKLRGLVRFSQRGLRRGWLQAPFGEQLRDDLKDSLAQVPLVIKGIRR